MNIPEENIPIALFDMDGTLFDYDGAVSSAMEKLRSPDEPPFQNQREHTPWERERLRLIKNTPGFWKNLKPLKAGFEILEAAVKAGFRIEILTAGPLTAPIAWMEKFQCCQEHLKDIPHQVTITRDKGLTYGAVLVDDYVPYGQAWLKHRPRGTLILPAQAWNEGFEHPQACRYTGNREEVQAIFDRIFKERTTKSN